MFDALSMRRPYKEPWPLDRIMQALHEGTGSHFDPEMVPVFASILPQVLQVKQRWDQREADKGEPFSASALLPP